MTVFEETEERSLRVFLSYSHDSPEHCDRVLTLAQQLRRDGIAVELDQFHQHELVHWPRWCEEQLRPENSDYVLCVCTAEYKRRIEGKVAADVGKGVFWEGTLIYNYLYDDKGNSRCVPVYLDDSDGKEIPAILKGYPRFQLQNLALDDANSNYVSLYRLLTKQSGREKAVVGQIRKLPPLAERKRQTDFGEIVEQILERLGELKSDTGEILSILKDRIPPPSSPGRPHNLPPWMTPTIFVGRSKELTSLCDELVTQSPSAVIQPQVVIGDGGLGKTRLAVQVLWLLYLQGKCDMAFYVSASSQSELDTQLAGLSEKSLLNLYANTEAPHELNTRRQDVIHALRNKIGRWVLLLDAADSQDARIATTRLLTELAGGSFLITSRRDDWTKGTVNPVRLDLFTPEEARDCLRSRYWKQKPSPQELSDFGRLAQELGRLPLALALAASYMESRRIAPARYLEEWKKKQDALLRFSADDLEHGRSLLATFQLSYERLKAPAAALLRLISWLAPEPLPRILVEESKRLKEILSADGKDSESHDVSDALAELRSLSLIRLDEESLQCHKLVLYSTRALLSEELRRESLVRTLKWLSASLPDAAYNEAAWNLWLRLAPHLDAIVESGDRYGTQGPEFANLCNQYGEWLYYQARHKIAEPLMRRALAIDEKILGPDNPNVAEHLNNLAQLLKHTNRLAEAEPLMRRALAINEKSFGPDHREVAIDLNNLALLLNATNRLAEAEPLMRRALTIAEKSLEPDHPDVAIRLNNLAQLLQDTNRLAEAEPLMRRALAIDEKSFGPDHPDVAIDLNNLAQLLKDTNRLAEAEPLMRRALTIGEKSFGPDHPNVARRLNNLAVLLQDTNRLAEAEPLMRQALTIDEKIFGPDHPNVARDLNNLAKLLQDTNRLAEAEPLMRRALTILIKFTRTTGHFHPHLRTVCGSYKSILAEMALAPEQIEQQLLESSEAAGFDTQSFQQLLSTFSKSES